MQKNIISISDLIKSTITLYTKYFNNFKLIILALSLPYLLISIFDLKNEIIKYIPITYEANLSLIIIFLLIAAAVIFVFLWFDIVLISLIYKIFKKERVSLDNNFFMQAFHKVPGYFAVTILASLIIGLGLILLIIPGIIFLIWYTFVSYVYVIEEKDNRGWLALVQSKQLVKGRWWQVFIRLLIPSILLLILLIIVEFGLSAIFLSISASYGLFAYIIVTSFLYAAIAPLETIFMILLYNNLKETK